MTYSLSSSPLISLSATHKPGLISHKFTIRNVNWMNGNTTHSSNNLSFEALKVNAAENKSETKTNSLLCPDCEGNGAKTCGQCEGTGTNLVDHFNGQYKAGAMCWLCRGKKEVLCGNCNGAGFLGGFMSALED